MILPNEKLAHLLKKKGYKVTYQTFYGGHDHLNWRGSLAKGLGSLLE